MYIFSASAKRRFNNYEELRRNNMGLKSQKNGKKFEDLLCKWFASQDYYVIYNERNVSRSTASRRNYYQK